MGAKAGYGIEQCEDDENDDIFKFKNIIVPQWLKSELDKLKLVERESYYSVIKRLLDYYTQSR